MSQISWEDIKQILKKELSQNDFHCFLSNVKFVSVDESSLVLSTNNPLFPHFYEIRSWEQLLKKNFSAEFKISLITEGSITPNIVNTGSTKKQPKVEKEYKYSFKNFLVSSSNQEAFKTMQDCIPKMLCKQNSHKDIIYLYSSFGLGKTHLCKALIHKCKEDYSDKEICYLDTSEFTNQYIYHIRENTSYLFQEVFSGIKLFVLENIDSLNNKKKIQQELINLIDILYFRNVQIVLTGHSSVANLIGIIPALRSKLLYCLNIPINKADIDLLKQFHHSFEMNVHLPSPLIDFLIHQCEGDLNLFRSCLKRIKASSYGGKEWNKEMIQEIFLSFQAAKKPCIKEIMELVCERFSVSEQKLIGKSRSAKISQARKICIYLCREKTGLSFKDLGKAFQRDFSTIMYSYKSVKKELNSDFHLKSLVCGVEQSLNYSVV